MAFDGVVIANIVRDMKERLVGGRVYKIYQPETDEINLVVKNLKTTFRLMLNASATLPLVYFLEENKLNPAQAPNFCMLLRKHIGNARIVSVSQPGLERIIVMEFEHLDEMGDLRRKKLIIELMGKYSNIIFTDEADVVIDSIKRIGAHISSVREVLPGYDYVLPPNTKYDPLTITQPAFERDILEKPLSIEKAIYTSLTGFSKLMAGEICYEAGVDGNFSTDSLADTNKERLWDVFCEVRQRILNGDYDPVIAYDQDEPVAFSALPLTMYGDMTIQHFDDISHLLREYYAKKDTYSRIHQKSTDIRRIVTTHLERSYKKLDIQEKQLKDTEKRDKFRIYGELINTYGYGITPGAKQFNALNYYTNEEITIPLDETLTPIENANKYFAKYNKLKRTYEAGTRLIAEIKDEIMYLESIINAIDIATTENDLNNIKDELAVTGYIKRSGKSKSKGNTHNKPMHYVSSDGFDIYVGKNNIQNDELTFKFATGGDWWFHAKQMPGSHVIVKTEGKELPDKTFEEAAALAAYYSKGRDLEKVEVDYVLKKEVKKPAGAKPGFVVYYTNYSLIAIADISGIRLISG